MARPRRTTKLVEEQIRRWQGERKQREKGAAASPPPPRVVALSRQCGSLGGSIGRRAAEILGRSFWDHELLDEVTRQTGIEQQVLESLDEKARSRLDEFLSEALMGSQTTAGEVSRQMFRIIRTIASHGDAVIVGRGAPFLVPRDEALRVRVVAPIELRVARMGKTEELSSRDADKFVRRTDREREAFYRHHFGVDCADPMHYDVVINSGDMSIEAAADIVVTAYRGRFG